MSDDERYNNIIKGVWLLLRNPLPDELVAGVAGNAPRAVKEAPIRAFQMYHRNAPASFAGTVTSRLCASEVSISPNTEDPAKNDCRIISEMTVEEDMVGPDGMLSQGCISLLIDETSAAATTAYFVLEGKAALTGLSQNLNVFFHTKASLGTRIRIIGRALGGNNFTVTSRGEIWDAETRRMIAHGEQVMMPQTGNWKTLDELVSLVDK
ncbi:hypothetical protein JOM56_009031 [Amanita muscaria]